MSSRFRKGLSHSVASLFGAAATLAAIQANNYGNDKLDEEIIESLSKLLQPATSNSNSTNTSSYDINYDNGDNANENIASNRQSHIKENEITKDSYCCSSSQSPFPYIQSPISTFQPNPNLQIVYDARTKNPMYVIERLHASNFSTSTTTSKKENKTPPSSSSSSSSSSNFHFHESKILPLQHRSRNSYYRNTGYDRGHLAPAADYKYDSKYKLDTFVLTNISPQYPFLNRNIWLRVEEWVRQQLVLSSNAYGDNDDDDDRENKNEGEGEGHENEDREVFVITGPMWLPSKKVNMNSSSSITKGNNNVFEYSFQGIGTPPSLVHVPTHFFKVVFIMKNKNTKNNKKNNDSSSNNTKEESKNDNNNHDNEHPKNDTTTRTTSTSTAHPNPNPSTLSYETVDSFAAFVIPNHPSIDDYTSLGNGAEGNGNGNGINHQTILLSDFMVCLGDIEAVTGISFFPLLSASTASTASLTTNTTTSSSTTTATTIKPNNPTLDLFDLITELSWCTTSSSSSISTSTDEGKNSSSSSSSSKKKCKLIQKKIRDHSIFIQNSNSNSSSYSKKDNNNKKKKERLMEVLPKHLCAKNENSQMNVCDAILYQTKKTKKNKKQPKLT